LHNSPEPGEIRALLKGQNMRQVSKTAGKVLDILTAELTEENRAKKIDNCNSVFMPVSVELIRKTEQGGYFSVCHYYEQNGDLMRDPEIVFLKKNSAGENYYFPVSYRQDNLGIDREYCRYDESRKITGLAVRPQADTAKFCNLWMLNIKRQQKLTR
jgi:hypothetical protein